MHGLHVEPMGEERGLVRLAGRHWRPLEDVLRDLGVIPQGDA